MVSGLTFGILKAMQTFCKGICRDSTRLMDRLWLRSSQFVWPSLIFGLREDPNFPKHAFW